MIWITTSGVISFISDAWGGRISHRRITIDSGLLSLLEPGDSVMADTGFTIEDLLKNKCCNLNIPPFLKGKSQFSTDQVLETQEIAELRIQVKKHW